MFSNGLWLASCWHVLQTPCCEPLLHTTWSLINTNVFLSISKMFLFKDVPCICRYFEIVALKANSKYIFVQPCVTAFSLRRSSSQKSVINQYNENLCSIQHREQNHEDHLRYFGSDDDDDYDDDDGDCYVKRMIFFIKYKGHGIVARTKVTIFDQSDPCIYYMLVCNSICRERFVLQFWFFMPLVILYVFKMLRMLMIVVAM